MSRTTPCAALTVALVLGLVSLARSEGSRGGAPSPPSGPIDRLPYRIRVLAAVDPSARVDARGRDALLADWLTLVRRFVGAPWSVEIASDTGSSAIAADPEALKPDALVALASGVDKVWAFRIGADGSGLVFEGREFDVTTRRLGPLQRRPAPVLRDAPRALFQFSLDLFSPYAEIGERFGNSVSIAVRGASVPPASPVGRVVVPGAIFKPLRMVAPRDGKPPVVREIPFTYLRVESAEGAGARCSLVTKNANPLTTNTFQKIKLVALGIKPGNVATRLKFSTRPDGAPAAGYVLTARVHPDGLVREVGTTDRGGRITLEPLYGGGLLWLRLIAGSSEPMREFPLMPGENDVERVIPAFDPKPLTVRLETQLDALRDEVIDLLAVRARLEARLKARFEGEEWAGVEEALKTFYSLPSRETFLARIKGLKDDAQAEQARLKRPILTSTAQAQLGDVQALIERYLDDEGFKAYAEAYEKVKTESSKAEAKALVQAKAKAKAKAQVNTPAPAPAKPAPRPAPPPRPEGNSGPAAPF